jgi:hypothetical protein
MAKLNLPSEVQRQLDNSGIAMYSLTGVQKQKYWTPDGRVVYATPSMRDYVRKKDGKVVESGVRDMNLVRGLLTQPPTDPKLYCPFCDQWHDTEEEIEECGIKKQKFDDFYTRKAQKMKEEETDINSEVAELKSEMADIKALLVKLVGEKNG